FSPARALPESRFVVAGSQYPSTVAWPSNVGHISHLEPAGHRAFYARQRFSLNVTRSAMVSDGYSPSVRLFEAAACGTPVISDRWRGIEQFFEPGEEILLADSASEVLQFLKLPQEQAREIGRRAHDRVMREHTAAHRAAELEAILESISMPLEKGTEVVR
ncbi:MAG TPA: glycosyltransferase, partial [Chthoniobacterales bacterium]